jgi:hypothetical protein
LLALSAGLLPLPLAAQHIVTASVPSTAAVAAEDTIGVLTRGSFVLVDAQGRTLSTLRRVGPVVTLSEDAVVQSLRRDSASADEIASLWEGQKRHHGRLSKDFQ